MFSNNMVTRTLAFLAILVLAVSAISAEEISQDQKKIYQAKDLMYEGNYTEAHKIFMEVFKNSAYERRDAALYYAALCSYKLEQLERAREEVEIFREAFNGSSWSDDISQLLNDVNRALGRTTGDVEAILTTQETREIALQAEEIAAQTEAIQHQVESIAENATGIVIRSGRFNDEDCNDPDGRKEAALNALIHMDDEEKVVSIIDKFLKKNPCDKLKAKAMFVLSQQETPKALDMMVKVAKTDPSPEVRKEALFWVGQFDDEKASEILISLYDDIDDVGSRKNIVFSLSQQDNEAALNKLISIAKTEKNEEIRKSAIHWISEYDDSPRVIVAMKEIYGNASESINIRKGVLFALSQNDDPEATKMLMQLAQNEPEAELRKNAIFWLGQCDDEEAVAEYLVKLYKNEKNLDVKNSILFSLGGVDTPEVVLPHLKSFYQAADSIDLKKRIIFTLARLGDDDDATVDLLIELLKNEIDPEAQKMIRFHLGQSDNPKAQEHIIQDLEEDLIG
jgi:HEAT repeat protein